MQRNLITSIYFEKKNIFVNVYHQFSDDIKDLTKPSSYVIYSKYEDYTFSVIDKKSLYTYSVTFNKNFDVNAAIKDILNNKNELNNNDVNNADFFVKIKEICYKYKI